MAGRHMRLSADIRAMENFVHAMDGRPIPTLEYEAFADDVSHFDLFALKHRTKNSDLPVTLRKFANEPLFSHGYSSEEEVASPMDADDMSFHSFSSESMTASQESVISVPKQLAPEPSILDQQCSRAQAVTLVPAGKAKVISMPKLIDVPATTRMRRPATATPRRPVVSQVNRAEVDGRIGSHSRATNIPNTSSTLSQKSPVLTASSANSTAPPTAELPTRCKSLRRRPTLPSLSFTARSQASTPTSSPESARPTHTLDFLSRDPFPFSAIEIPATPMSPSKRRLRKFSSSLGLNMFGRSLKRNAASDKSSSGEEPDAIKEPEPFLLSPPPPTPKDVIPTRTASLRPRMAPRGANERAPPLVLPACPDDYNHNRTYVVSSLGTRLPGRDAVPRVLLSEDASAEWLPKPHGRHRSVSAALMSLSSTHA